MLTVKPMPLPNIHRLACFIRRRGGGRLACLLLALAAAGARTAVAKEPVADKDDEAIAKAIAFLLAKQSDDGGIKSQAYGVLRSGAAMTALTLYAVSHAPDDATAPHRKQLDKAYAFLKRGIDKTGTVAAPDGTLDYPTYGCALVLLAADRLKLDISPEDRDRLTQWIIDNQLGERHEIAADSIQYGGWDLEAASGAKGEQLKGTNISITSFALEALSASMHKDAPAAVRRARGWAAGCQNDDGGFVFHPWRPHPGNKALWNDDPQTDAISYGTPTCDGLRCLMYCGFKPNDDRVKSAVKWLGDHPDVKLVPGFAKAPKERSWREGLRFYYYFTQAKALRFLPEEEARRRAKELRSLLLVEQRADGSFKNKTPRMFEDDPLLATSLAIIALAEANKHARP